ncbi:hypothetical protein K3495_g91 [Podosphaera aphanis]|nr:hypothetical protein K3495_g91 [Podosphaera aphanis]
MKVTINGLARPQGQSWAKVASKTGTTGATIRIQDKSEKQEIAKFSSEELVKKIGMKEVIGAKKMVSGKVLIHNMPLTSNPEDKNQIKELQQTNLHYMQGITIQKVAWLKRTKVPGKTSGSLIVWFDQAEQAELAITKGMMWRYELKVAEIFRSGFRLMQCYNCQKIAAKAKAAANRIHDSGKLTIQESQGGNQENGWQIVDSMKRRAGTSVVELSRPVGEAVVRRDPGRPRKNPGLDVPDMRATWEKMLNTPNTPTTSKNKENEPRTVARDNQAETNRAPECEMQSRRTQIL